MQLISLQKLIHNLYFLVIKILQASKSELRERFERYGKVIDVTMKDGRDRDIIAFVEYDDVRDAEFALDK